MSFFFRGSSIAFLCIIASCQSVVDKGETKADEKIHVKTVPVIRGDIADTVTIFGELKLREEAWLSSQFEGRLVQFSMLKGDKVKKGQLAGVIIPAGREALLQATDSIPDEYKYILNQQEKSISLICPISGIVLDVLQHTGDVVSKGGHIAHIGDIGVLDVQGELPIQFLEMARNTKRMKVEFTNFNAPKLYLPIEAFTGEVSKNQSIIVRLKLNNSLLFYRPGMRVKISFPALAHTNALLVPRQALIEEEGNYFLFAVENGKTIKLGIKVGIMQNDVVEIISGVSENQVVAVERTYSLRNDIEVIAE